MKELLFDLQVLVVKKRSSSTCRIESRGRGQDWFGPVEVAD